jgi:dephospho-CoA kinase
LTKPRVIGLTGGIASGKSEAAKILENLGAKIIDADKIARDVVELPELRDVLRREWPQAFEKDVLDRKKLGRAIFSSREEREKLNRILHPAIIQRALEEVRQSSSEVCVVVAPLLIESGLHHMVDEVWVVHAPREIQIKRLRERDGISEAEAIRMIDSQLATEEKLSHAQHAFNNSGSPEALKTQIETIWTSLGTFP